MIKLAAVLMKTFAALDTLQTSVALTQNTASLCTAGKVMVNTIMPNCAERWCCRSSKPKALRLRLQHGNRNVSSETQMCHSVLGVQVVVKMICCYNCHVQAIAEEIPPPFFLS